MPTCRRHRIPHVRARATSAPRGAVRRRPPGRRSTGESEPTAPSSTRPSSAGRPGPGAGDPNSPFAPHEPVASAIIPSALDCEDPIEHTMTRRELRALRDAHGITSHHDRRDRLPDPRGSRRGRSCCSDGSGCGAPLRARNAARRAVHAPRFRAGGVRPARRRTSCSRPHRPSRSARSSCRRGRGRCRRSGRGSRRARRGPGRTRRGGARRSTGRSAPLPPLPPKRHPPRRRPSPPLPQHRAGPAGPAQIAPEALRQPGRRTPHTARGSAGVARGRRRRTGLRARRPGRRTLAAEPVVEATIVEVVEPSTLHSADRALVDAGAARRRDPDRATPP